MKLQPAVGVILTVAFLAAGLAGSPAPTATADVQLVCPDGDWRTSADRLPRPGVVIVHRHYSATLYLAHTVSNLGELSPIFWRFTAPYSVPHVSTWENATDCDGDEDSRNVWAVGPTGKVHVTTGQMGPPAGFFGDASTLPLQKPIVGMSPTASGMGYWLVASDGGVFTYGDAQFFGSTGNIRLNKPIVGMSVTPTGNGYWLVASDGGIFTFGDARFFGSTGNISLNKPISAMTATPSGNGYWMVASDGGIFTFGDAPFKGSTGGMAIPAPIAGMIANGSGYYLIGDDSSLYAFP